jgi:hypothetical protein
VTARHFATAIAVLAGCQASASPQDPLVPWLHGMSGLSASEHASASATRRLDALLPVVDNDACGAGAYQAIELVADIAPAPGSETILGSYAHGIAVLDRSGQLLASTNGYRCDASVDEIEAIAAGRAFGEPTLVVVAKTGGRRAYTRFVGLFRLGFAKRLDPVFTATVEEHDGDEVRTGAIVMLQDALVYRLPDGRYAYYVFDPVGRVYLAPVDPLDDPHHEPPIEDVPRESV